MDNSTVSTSTYASTVVNSIPTVGRHNANAPSQRVASPTAINLAPSIPKIESVLENSLIKKQSRNTKCTIFNVSGASYIGSKSCRPTSSNALRCEPKLDCPSTACSNRSSLSTSNETHNSMLNCKNKKISAKKNQQKVMNILLYLVRNLKLLLIPFLVLCLL